MPTKIELTFVDKEFIRHVATGASTKEIAGRMNMAASTIESYRVRICRFMGARNSPHLVAIAIHKGLITAESPPPQISGGSSAIQHV